MTAAAHCWEHNERFYICSLPAGHDGPHEAWAEDPCGDGSDAHIAASWPCDTSEPPSVAEIALQPRIRGNRQQGAET